jgi:hypothetical protein
MNKGTLFLGVLCILSFMLCVSAHDPICNAEECKCSHVECWKRKTHTKELCKDAIRINKIHDPCGGKLIGVDGCMFMTAIGRTSKKYDTSGLYDEKDSEVVKYDQDKKIRVMQPNALCQVVAPNTKENFQNKADIDEYLKHMVAENFKGTFFPKPHTKVQNHIKAYVAKLDGASKKLMFRGAHA